MAAISFERHGSAGDSKAGSSKRPLYLFANTAICFAIVWACEAWSLSTSFTIVGASIWLAVSVSWTGRHGTGLALITTFFILLATDRLGQNSFIVLGGAITFLLLWCVVCDNRRYLLDLTLVHFVKAVLLWLPAGGVLALAFYWASFTDLLVDELVLELSPIDRYCVASGGGPYFNCGTSGFWGRTPVVSKELDPQDSYRIYLNHKLDEKQKSILDSHDLNAKSEIDAQLTEFASKIRHELVVGDAKSMAEVVACVDTLKAMQSNVKKGGLEPADKEIDSIRVKLKKLNKDIGNIRKLLPKVPNNMKNSFKNFLIDKIKLAEKINEKLQIAEQKRAVEDRQWLIDSLSGLSGGVTLPSVCDAPATSLAAIRVVSIGTMLAVPVCPNDCSSSLTPADRAHYVTAALRDLERQIADAIHVLDSYLSPPQNIPSCWLANSEKSNDDAENLDEETEVNETATHSVPKWGSSSALYSCKLQEANQTLIPAGLKISTEQTLIAQQADIVMQVERAFRAVTQDIQDGKVRSGEEVNSLLSHIKDHIRFVRKRCRTASITTWINCAENFGKSKIEKAYHSGMKRAKKIVREEVSKQGQSLAIASSDAVLLARSSAYRAFSKSAHPLNTALDSVFAYKVAVGYLTYFLLTLIAMRSFGYFLLITVLNQKSASSRNGKEQQSSFTEHADVTIALQDGERLYSKFVMHNQSYSVRFVPWPLVSIYQRIMNRCYFILNFGGAASTSDAVHYSPPNGWRVIKWRLQPGQDVYFSFKDFLAATDGISFTGMIDFSAASTILGRRTHSVAINRTQRDQYLFLLVDTKVLEGALGPATFTPECLVAWDSQISFGVITQLTWKSVYCDGVLLSRSSSGRRGLLARASTNQLTLSSGAFRFVKMLFKPI